MTSPRGSALLVALLVLVIGASVAASALGWGMLQIRSGRGWLAAARNSANVESVAARWRAGDTTAAVARWTVTDSLLLIRISPAGLGQAELLCWRDTLNKAAAGSANCVTHRAFLRGPR